MFYDHSMSDMPPPPPPPPNPGQQGSGAQGGADVWGDDTNGRAGFGNRLGNYLLDALLYGVAMLIPMYIGAFMVASSLFDCDFFFTDLAECSGETDATRFVGGVALGTLRYETAERFKQLPVNYALGAMSFFLATASGYLTITAPYSTEAEELMLNKLTEMNLNLLKNIGTGLRSFMHYPKQVYSLSQGTEVSLT